MTGKKMSLDERRVRVLELLESGLIMQIEAAKLAGVTRQAVGYWMMKAGLKPGVARRRYLRELMRDH